MLQFDSQTGKIENINAGTAKGFQDTYVVLAKKQSGVLYEPVIKSEKSETGILIMHSDKDYSDFAAGRELAKKGYTCLACRVRNAGGPFEEKLRDVQTAVRFLKNYAEIKKVIFFGHSGGATLLSAYQAIAENGAGIFQTDEMLIKCAVSEKLPAADGVMLIDSNWGNGAMTLISVDPAVVEEHSGCRQNTEFDPYSTENGYQKGGAHYTRNFLKRYFEEQRDRNNRLLHQALDRLTLIEQGKGLYNDDEPFTVPGGAQAFFCNKLIPQDLHLLAHTKQAHPLLCKDDIEKNVTVSSVRRPESFGNTTASYKDGCLATTVRNYLSEHAVQAAKDYRISETGIEGILCQYGYNCPPGNVRHIHAPLLCMGMTGGYEIGRAHV